MKKVDGVWIEETAEEIAAMQEAMEEARRQREAEEMSRPMTAEQLQRLLAKEQEKVQFLGLLAAGVDINELMSEEEEDGE